MSLEGGKSHYASARDKLVSLVASRTGVDANNVKTVLTSLGIDHAFEEIVQAAGADKLSQLTLDNVAVCIRYNHTIYAK